MAKTAVIIYPGSNCDRDVISAIHRVTGHKPHAVWHMETMLPDVDVVVLPGGFSYGDYLRCGAMAARSPIVAAVKHHVQRGGYALGICNGFQILTETGLLQGVLRPNAGLRFVCKDTFLRVEHSNSLFTRNYQKGQVIAIPVAHHDGNYFATDAQLKQLEDGGQIAFRYCDAKGNITENANPNGSLDNIAGITDAEHRVLGMMPHPERHVDALTGGEDGIPLFAGLGALLDNAA